MARSENGPTGASVSTQPPTPPPGYRLDPVREAQRQLQNVPDFLKPTASQSKIEVAPANSDYAAEVQPWAPRTVKYFGEDQITQPTTTHEVTHEFQDSRNLSVVGDEMYNILAGRTNKSYDYGGIDGLLKAQQEHKSIEDFGPEQQADIVMDYQQLTQDAIAKGDAAKLDRVNAAYGRYVKQLASLPGRGESMTTMTQKDLTPPAPGLPPATESGILEPSPLLGGQVGVYSKPSQATQKHSPKPPPGYRLEK